MTPESFKSLRQQAATLHATQGARDKARVSLDAIFTALAVASSTAEAPKVRRTSDEAPPEWFHDTLKRLKGTGERFTVGRFLMLAGKFPATRSDSINVGRWLREAKIVPRKTGGQMLFEADGKS